MRRKSYYGASISPTDETRGTERLQNMDQSEMFALVERHLKAEGAGDIEGCVAVYTDDIEHDAVGFPGAPCHGKEAARAFYQYLTENFRTEDEEELHRYVSDDALTL